MSKSKHIPALDGVRGIAVLMVVLVHYGGGASFSNIFIRAIGLTLKIGWSGVTLFFLLSGFLITGILWDGREAPHWWRNFYIRRSLRIFPLYYAALLLVIAGAVYQGTFRLCLTRIWVFFLYLQNFPSLRHIAGAVASPLPMGHFWSLAVEEQFYLIWPFLITRMKSLRQAESLCLALFVLSAIFRIVIWTWHPDPFSYNQSLPTHAGELALGGYLAMRYRGNGWKTIESWTPLAMVLSLSGFLAVCFITHDFTGISTLAMYIGLPCITIFLAGVLVLALGDGVVHRAASAGWLRWLGGISYGVYIFHVLLLPFYHHIPSLIAPHASRNGALLIDSVSGIIFTTLIAWLSFRFFESPFLRLKNRFEPARSIQSK